MKKVIVSITNDITTDQRVEKVCNTLYKNGFDILLIGRKLINSKAINRKYKVVRLKLFFNKGFLFYAEYNFRLFFKLLFLKKDILLSNDLDTLLANYSISKLQSKKLVYDSHELFPEIPELVAKPTVKKIWTSLESSILPKLKNNYTVCNSISEFYKNKYNVDFKIIKNFPNKSEKTEFGSLPFNIKNKKIIIYQGAINLGRGIELILKAMLYLHNHIFLIIGSGDVLSELKQLTKELNIQEKVLFMGRLSPKELRKLTPLANLGISLEEDLGLNYRFALPNKIFDYIQAEIPILISDLPEMKKIVLEYNVGEIVKNREPKNIANQIKLLLEKDLSKELQRAKRELIWEKQEEELLSIFNNLK